MPAIKTWRSVAPKDLIGNVVEADLATDETKGEITKIAANGRDRAKTKIVAATAATIGEIETVEIGIGEIIGVDRDHVIGGEDPDRVIVARGTRAKVLLGHPYLPPKINDSPPPLILGGPCSSSAPVPLCVNWEWHASICKICRY